METTFFELYSRLVKAGVDGNQEEREKVAELGYDEHQLDCLFHPDRHAPVWQLGQCRCEDGDAACRKVCLFDAITKDEQGNIFIKRDGCVGCAACIDECKAKNLTESRDILPLLDAVHQTDAPVYAMIAPAFVSQYSSEVTPGRLRSAFKALGFAGMIEVALFADLLTLKEALEFDQAIKTEEDYLLTSCCCPIWIAMIRKVYKKLMPHVPGSVSPMVACGRAIKKIHPDAITVFVGPCVAKKAEAREPDIADAVDFVLTFAEVQDLFDAAGIDPAGMEEDLRDHSSKAGRIYARTGGVSEAVHATVQRLTPDRKIGIKTTQADGVPACKELLNRLMDGSIDANFIEGMGCVGGCVGGPKAILPKEQGRENVNEYSEEAIYQTPADNPYVIDLLHRIGFDTIGSLLHDNDIFTRSF